MVGNQGYLKSTLQHINLQRDEILGDKKQSLPLLVNRLASDTAATGSALTSARKDQGGATTERSRVRFSGDGASGEKKVQHVKVTKSTKSSRRRKKARTPTLKE